MTTSDTTRTGASADEEGPFKPLPEHEVTQLLQQIRSEPDLFDQVVPMVYDDLKRIGHNQRKQFASSLTMQTTALVHEAFIKLKEHSSGEIENRAHLRRLAAMVMRQLIFDYARRQNSQKRGSGQVPVELDDERVADVGAADRDLVLAVERILDQMEASNPRMAEIVSARFFAGFSIDEIADMLDLSGRTVSRELTRARAWMKTELEDFERSV
jgi:RNA polymerase sigma factor (TIGR02999 family)